MRKLSFEEITRQRLQPGELKNMPRFPFYLLLDNIRSLYNVGSAFRTADAVRLEKLILCGITGYPPRKEIDKTALGAVNSVPWEYQPSGVAAVKDLKNKGIPVVVLEHTDNSIIFRDMEYTFPVCLVVGNEVDGVQDEIIKLADGAIEIPMFGSKQSLNVSVAVGIVLYHLLACYLEQEPARLNSIIKEANRLI